MLDRYSLCASPELLQKQYDLEALPSFTPYYNAAPTLLLPFITHESPNGFSYFYWGSSPKESLQKGVAEKWINIKVEDVQRKPLIQKKIMSHRGIAPADGFYVWKKIGKNKVVPYRYTSLDQPVLSMAAVWEEFEEDGNSVHTFQLFTQTFHWENHLYTIPIFLLPEQRKLWLRTDTPQAELIHLLHQTYRPKFTFFPVDPRIQKIDYNSALLLQAAPPADQYGNLTLFD